MLVGTQHDQRLSCGHGCVLGEQMLFEDWACSSSFKLLNSFGSPLHLPYQIGVINKWFQTNPFYSMLWPWASHLNSLSLSPLMYKMKTLILPAAVVSEKKKKKVKWGNCLLNFKVNVTYNYNFTYNTGGHDTLNIQWQRELDLWEGS